MALLGSATALLLASCIASAPSAAQGEPVLSIARWGLEAGELPGPDDRSIGIGVWEVPCSGGRDIGDKVLPPQVSYEPLRVVVTIFLEPLPTLGPNEALTCPLAPPVPYELELSEPLGDRALVDGNRTGGGGAMWGGLVDPGLIGPWQLVEGTLLGEVFTPVGGSSVTFAVHGDTAVGSGGCNGYSATPVVVRPDAITIPPPSSHLVLCPDGRSLVEERFFQALARASQFQLPGARLELSGEGTKLVFSRPE
jgi:heat shock protein HslJ